MTFKKMETVLGFIIVFAAISGLSKGADILPNGTLNAVTGGSVLFNIATPPETPFAAVNWTFGATAIGASTPTGVNIVPEYQGRARIFHSNGSLELSSLTLNDSGVYGVTIIPAAAGPEQHENITLKVYAPVSNVKLNPTTVNLFEFNGSLQLNCSFSGSSSGVVWVQKHTVVTGSGRLQITDGGRLFTIDNVTRDLNGLFHCEVSNPFSVAISNTATVTVYYGPDNVRLTPSSENQYLAGSDITMFCSAESKPSAQFTWFLDGSKLTHTGSQLKLMNVHEDQSGNYSCQAFNNKTLRYQSSEPFGINIQPSPGGSSGCGAGCIAGIVIACIVLVAALVGGGYFIYRKKKKTTTESKPTVVDDEKHHYENISALTGKA